MTRLGYNKISAALYGCSNAQNNGTCDYWFGEYSLSSATRTLAPVTIKQVDNRCLQRAGATQHGRAPIGAAWSGWSRSIAVKPTPTAGKLLALADVSVTWEEMTMEVRSIRVEMIGPNGAGGTKVSMPVDREGRAILVLPQELSSAVADVVLAAGIEAGILKERQP